MKSAPKPQNESQRLAALEELNILDTLHEKDFDQITFLAAQICGVPIALISLVDKDRQWFKSKVGLDATETPRDLAFCAHAILGDDVFVVEDSSKDDRFADNPLATGGPHVQFYAGAPLYSPDGHAIGTVCVIDTKPRVLEPEKLEALKMLSAQVTSLLELRVQVAKLKESEEKLRFKNKAVETILEGVVLHDSTGAIVDFNSSALELLSLTQDQIRGKTSMDPRWRSIREDGSAFPGEEHPAMICLKTGQPQRNAIMGIQVSNEGVRWLRINIAPIFTENIKLPSFVVASFADVSAEINAKRHAEMNRSQLRFILDGIPHFVGLWDKQQKVIESNYSFSQMFEKKTATCENAQIKDVFCESFYSKSKASIERAFAGERVETEVDFQLNDGSTKYTLATFIPNLEQGQVSSLLTVVADITTSKNLQKEQSRLEARLADSAKLAALGEMAAGIAHEVNNPLAIIRSKAEILSRKISNAQIDPTAALKDLKLIESTADRIAKIVRALRVYSRDAENDDMQPTEFGEIINDTLELCREKFSFSQIDIRVQVEANLFVNCRSAQISQVLMNLLSNAFDVMVDLEQKWVQIKAFKKDDQVRLEFTDSGFGIPDHVVEKMMNPFYTTKDVGKGTGLGLSISSGILQSHGGSLEYVKGKHTTFLLVLPSLAPSSQTKAA